MSQPTDPPSESPAGNESAIQIQATPPPFAVKKEKTEAKFRRRLTPERLAREIRRLDRAMVVVVVVLAFFLASFTAQNSDVWMHLATGRLIAQGQYSFGVDPFSCNTRDVYWVNHSWLTDLLGYLKSQALGGPETPLGGGVLVVLKAVVVTLLAGVMLAIRRPGQTLWPHAFCVALALLAMSPRLLLQPTTISFLFLALTLWLLTEEVKAPEDDASHDQVLSRRRLIFLPLLFALWANLDAWFLLGPVIVLLFLLGVVLQEALAPIHSGPDAPRPGIKQRLLIMLGLGLAACLLNPHHVRVFQPPSELGLFLSSSPLRDEPLFRGLFLSPLQEEYLSKPALGLHAAGLSYIPLVLLGIISFVLNGRHWHAWRVTVWLSFFVASAFWVRGVPFFAVVAGPITALNLQDFAARRFGVEPSIERGWKNWSLFGRAGTLLALVLLVIIAWPGWLHGLPDVARASRRVSWALLVDPSLRSASERTHALRQEGAFRSNSNAFNFAPEIAAYLAWFSPEEKSFFDFRAQLFSEEVVQEYLDVRQGLLPSRRPTGSSPQADRSRGSAAWQSIFRDPQKRIDHVIISGADWRGTFDVVGTLWNQPDQWTMLYMDGRSTIFGWKDPRAPQRDDAFRRYRYDPDSAAFGRDLAPENRSPDHSVEPPLPRDWFDNFIKGPTPRALASDESLMHLNYFYFSSEQRRNDVSQLLQLGRSMLAFSRTAGMTGSGSIALPTSFDMFLQGGLFESVRSGVTSPGNLGNLASAILAVRAARRAVAESPNDADNYIALAKAYVVLWRNSVEPGGGFLADLRHIEVVNALQMAVSLNPNAPEALEAHEMLFGIYAQNDFRKTPYLDLAAAHLQSWVQIAEPLIERMRPDERENLNGRKELLKKVSELLRARRESFLLKSANLALREKVGFARENRLAQQEVELWQEAMTASVSQLSRSESAECIGTLLRTGNYVALMSHAQAQELFQQAEQEPSLRFLTVIASCAGDYGGADKHLADLIRFLDTERLAQLLRLTRTNMIQSDPQPLFDLSLMLRSRGQFANLVVVRGLLALEAGDTTLAAERFREALAMRVSPMHIAAFLTQLSPGSSIEVLSSQAGDFLGGGLARLDFEYSYIAARYLQFIEAEQVKRR